MTEAVYNASGLGMPIVMTIGNRAIGAPINIWNDQSDSMSMRDAGWIELHAENNQEAVDLHIQAFRLAEALSCPVMVCMDGYVLTHAFEAVDIPSQEQVDRYLPAFEPRMSSIPPIRSRLARWSAPKHSLKCGIWLIGVFVRRSSDSVDHGRVPGSRRSERRRIAHNVSR